jgi:thiamine-phosphate pyrophosphorylase
MASGPMLELLDRAVERSRKAGVLVIVNDRADQAALAGADGVHVGQTDLRPADVRRMVGPNAIVGRSTHNLAQAREACDGPISYLAIGPVFATSTKVDADPVVGLDGVREAATLAAARHLPLIAIGGITLATAPQVLAAGAHEVAVISDLLVGDPAVRIEEYCRALSGLTL